MKKIITIIFFVLIIIAFILFYKADKDVEITSADTNINSVKIENSIKEKNLIKEDYIEHDNKNKEHIQEKSQQEEIKDENETNINAQNVEIKKEDDKNTSNNIFAEDLKDTIKETLSPNGFMGSSLLKVALYSNGEVYLLNYDGEGYEEKNILGKVLLATDASSIYSKGKGEEFEAIVIKGSTNFKVKNRNYSWIEFEF